MIAAETTRHKLAVILSVELASTAPVRAGLDAPPPGGWRRAMIEAVAEVTHGRVFEAGQGWALIEFTSVVDAARCALQLQRRAESSLAALSYRIGIHLGDVAVDAEQRLTGDSIRIARQLARRARLGRISLSAAAYEQVRDKIELRDFDLGEQNPGAPASSALGPEPEARPQAGPEMPMPAADSKAIATPRASAAASGPSRLSIVVLPFTNIGGEFEQEYFVDGVTESLTTDLSRIKGSLVIARNTAFSFKGRSVDLKQIGRELGVRYVLEGSVQSGAGRLRVNVQLIDAESASHLWAERFDKPVADFFDLQDEIVARLANQLETELVSAEARRAAHAPNPDSMDRYFQGMAKWHEGKSPEHLTEARGFFEQALALDPSNLEASFGTALADYQLGAAFMTDDRTARLATAEATLTRVLTQAPRHAPALCYLGGVHIATKRAVQGMAECERALGLDRNLAAAHSLIGLAKTFMGRGEENEAHQEEARRLSPRDPNVAVWMMRTGGVKSYLGRQEDAVAWLRRAIEANRSYPFAYFYLAAALVQLGQKEEARAVAAAGLAVDPGFTVTRFRTGAPSDNATYLAQRGRIEAAMREAGVPEF
jgi:TolB-like protein